MIRITVGLYAVLIQNAYAQHIDGGGWSWVGDLPLWAFVIFFGTLMLGLLLWRVPQIFSFILKRLGKNGNGKTKAENVVVNANGKATLDHVLTKIEFGFNNLRVQHDDQAKGRIAYESTMDQKVTDIRDFMANELQDLKTSQGQTSAAVTDLAKEFAGLAGEIRGRKQAGENVNG